ncbi:holo-ACP synthase [Halothiobacillus sp.]|uniref:holo-ACP synthase n=1 Tax=Halothiobacillus sp. TaxID=1891311 RepID=UPI002620DD42|nr:holo-ACP synthase [Halothiobacillus sp.]
MILGIGTDLVEIDRLAKSYARYGDRLVHRILGVSERVAAPASDSPRFTAWLAKRFAAKEAAVKALGTGFSGGISLHDIQTIHDEHGAPELIFGGLAQQRLDEIGAVRVHLSISDERSHALAFVVIEGGD